MTDFDPDGLKFLAGLVALYLLPSIIAKARGMKNALSMFFLNLFLGWTGFGWVGALCWAVADTAEIRTLPPR